VIAFGSSVNLFLPLADPVVKKELGGMSRRGRTFFGRVFYVTLAGIIVYSVASPVLDGGATLSTSEYARLGRKLFEAFAWLQMLFLPLVSAVAASDVVHREARVGTLQLLLLTPLTGDRIISGKWKAVMLETLTLGLSGAPAMAVAVYLGGAGVEDIAWCFCLSFVLSGISAAMAICYSLRDRTVVEAAFRAYLVLQFSALPYGFLYATLHGSDFPLGFAAAWIHPYCAWHAAANPGLSGLASHGWIGATLVSLWVARRYLRSAAGHLKNSRELSGFLEGPIPGKPKEDPNDILWRKAPGPVWDRWPLLWKECSLRSVRLSPAARSVLFVLFSLLTMTCVFGRPESALILLFVVGPVSLVVGVALGSGHFAREKEHRGFEMLLSTPLSPGHVVAAKLLSGVIGLEFLGLMAFMAVGFVVLVTGREASGLVVLTVGAFVLFSYVLASALSLRSRTYRTAFVSTAAVVVFVLVGIPVLMNLLAGSPMGHVPALRFASYALHPFRFFMAEELIPYDGWVVPVNLLTYVAGSLALVGHMILRFRAVAQGR
jgi:ABC-type transport system involved in multi-copper enzyme maturation permease subunit